MADSNNNFKSTVEALFKGMDAVVSSKQLSEMRFILMIQLSFPL